MSIAIESRAVNWTAGQGSHLYLTLIPIDTLPRDYSVIRCGPTTESATGPWGPLVGQVNILLQSSLDNYTPDDEFGGLRGRKYISPSSSEDVVWMSMASVANSMLSQNYEYNAFAREVGLFNETEARYWVALNSNSFITSILKHVGIEPATNLPTNLGITPGLQTLLDVAGGHTLSADGYFADIFAGDGSDTVNGDSQQNYLFGGSGNDILNGGGGDDILSGGSNSDTLNGNAGNDILFGNDASADTLRGGDGVDQLNGSAGADRFDFDSINESGTSAALADRIRYYELAIDHIDISSIDANPTISGNQAFTFVGIASFTGVGQMRVNNFGGSVTYVYLNTVGISGTDMLIRLDGAHLLTIGDFIL